MLVIGLHLPLLLITFASVVGLPAIPPRHISPAVHSLASDSDLIVVATVPHVDTPDQEGALAVEVEDVWKGKAIGPLRVTATAPWMPSPWQPRSGERFVLFLAGSDPAVPRRLLDVGAARFRVVPFSPPVVDVWPGLLPGTILQTASCRMVGFLGADGKVTYKKVCSGSFTTPLSVLREAVAAALSR